MNGWVLGLLLVGAYFIGVGCGYIMRKLNEEAKTNASKRS